MSESRRVRGPVLVVIGVALIVITTLMLLALRGGGRRPSTEESDPSASGPARRSAGIPPAPGSPSANAVPSPTPSGGTAPEPTAVRQWRPARLPPYTRRVEVSPPVPAEIQNESDPVKKEALLKMHRLTTARVRVSMLRRRRDLLQSSITEAREKGTWTAAKIQDAERQLAEVRGAAVRAEQNLNHIREQVGGDIDRGER